VHACLPCCVMFYVLCFMCCVLCVVCCLCVACVLRAPPPGCLCVASGSSPWLHSLLSACAAAFQLGLCCGAARESAKSRLCVTLSPASSIAAWDCLVLTDATLTRACLTCLSVCLCVLQAGMELRVLHSAARRMTWYGRWQYGFGRGGFNMTPQQASRCCCRLRTGSAAVKRWVVAAVL
jgi:hypothetical protein